MSIACNRSVSFFGCFLCCCFCTILLMTRILVLNSRNHMIIIHDVQNKLNQRNKYLQEDRSFRYPDVLRNYFNSTLENYWTLLNSTNQTVAHEETDVTYMTRRFLDNYFRLCNKENSIFRDNDGLPLCPCIPDTISMHTCPSVCLSISIMSFGDRVFFPSQIGKCLCDGKSYPYFEISAYYYHEPNL